MWYFLQLVAAIFFCCSGGSMNQAGGHEGSHFRRCVEVRSSGSERVPCRVDGAPIRIDSVAKNGVQTAVVHVLQVMISETSALNLMRDDQLVSLVQVKKMFFSRATHSGMLGSESHKKSELRNGFGARYRSIFSETRGVVSES